jgi:transcriptional regulator with GAF, ATPase, and Fis domain
MERNSGEWLKLSELKAGARVIGGMVVKSARIKRLYQNIARLGPYKATILIQGESGTGKELAAQALHRLGPNPNGPFVTFNCSNLVESLAESQLFGHVKGAFTDAREDSIGYFRAANGGTLFLDEIGELPPTLQPKLLRVVETHEVQPVGSSRNYVVNIRLIAATNRDLRAMVNEGKFRSDLFYRLASIPIVMPTLRQRLEAIDAISAHFIEHCNREFGKNVAYVSRRALEALMAYDWPGNLRELNHAIQSAVMMSEDDRVDLELLPESVLAASRESASPNRFEPPAEGWREIGALKNNAATEVPEAPAMSYRLHEAIKAALVRALREANGNCHLAAKLLGISRYTVYRMMTRYGLGQVRNYRDDPGDDYGQSTG